MANIIMADSKGGDTVYYSAYGSQYMKNMEIPISDNSYTSYKYRNCTELETVRVYNPNDLAFSSAGTSMFSGCTKLKSAILECYKGTSQWALDANPQLKTVQIGKIGVPVSALAGKTFNGNTQSNLAITIYVDDATPIPLANSPWGATNATIIYRSSTTGEVRTV